MPTRIVKDEYDRGLTSTWLLNLKPPFVVNVQHGNLRSTEQNRLQRLWLNEAAEQLEGHTAEELRALCKLTLGVPILRAENDVFRHKYDAAVRGLDYERKIMLMSEPLDMPVTRIMTSKQKTTYLEAMQKYFTEQGVQLTEPRP